MNLTLRSDYMISEEDIRFLTCCCSKCYNALYPPWLLTIQQTVSKVVSQFYQLPKQRRSCLQILEFIEKAWPKTICLFESKKHYYQTLLTITDALLTSLPIDANQEYPVVFNHTDTWIEEVNVQLRLRFFVVTFPSKDTYILKKYLVFNHPIYIESLQHMFRCFCHRHLYGLVGKIELVNLLDGTILRWDMPSQDIQSSLDYVRLIKEIRSEEDLYRIIQ